MTKGPPKISQPLVFGVCLAGVLAILFFQSFNPSQVHFSNDGPLGVVNAAAATQPSGFKGLWFDLNSIGTSAGSFYLSITSVLLWLLGPLFFSKFYVPLALSILGICAWLCFRRLKLTPLASLLGALAVTLNSTFFSAACWGVGSQVILIGMSYLAVGLLYNSDTESSHPWIKTALAGFAIGMGVMEGFDVGAIFSLLMAAFVIFQALSGEGSVARRTFRGLERLAVVAVCAGFLACHAVIGLVSTQIQGVAGTEQDTRTKVERWDWATQWSLPKREALSLLVPGIFGYRMDTPAGGNYWGAAGRDPAWDRYFAGDQTGSPPGGFIRYSGGGIYAGVLVMMVAVWCALQSFRKDDALYTGTQRKYIRFWIAVVIVTLLLSFGRHAPFYQFLYALPYFSTIRNPAKFLHILTFAVGILFAYGLDGLSRRYMATSPAGGGGQRFKLWWDRASRYDKRWVIGSFMTIGASLLGWLIYASSRDSLERYLQTVQFDETASKAIAGFSIGQAGWFVLFLVGATALMTAVLSGRFKGQKATWGAILLGLFLFVDLGRANLPWILYWDYHKKYATNPVIEFLREKPYEHRVAILPFQPPRQFALLNDLYRIDWAQHHFQYYNIQSLDIVQMPRMPADLLAFENALRGDNANAAFRITRRWELTNTRYLLGAAGYLDVLNQQVDPEQKRFRYLLRFDLVPKPGIENPRSYEDLTATLNTNGQYSVIEFTGALPRTSLYTNWQVTTNEQTTLSQLTSPTFDPARTVLVSNPIPASDVGATNNTLGTVEFASYAPKDIRLRAKAASPSVLLLNDRYDGNWRVTVDGKPETLLRCNYLMRGVQVPVGDHEVRFLFQPSVKGLYVSLAAIVVALGLLAFLGLSKAPDPITPNS